MCPQLDLCVKPLKTLTLYEMMLDLMKEEEESIQQIRTSMREVTITTAGKLHPSSEAKTVTVKTQSPTQVLVSHRTLKLDVD